MRISKELMKGTGATLILGVLANADLYGYRIVKALEEKSAGEFVMNEGTLYPILHALEQEGCLESYWEEAEGRRRKYYHITAKGRRRLKEKAKEWERFSKAVSGVLQCAT